MTRAQIRKWANAHVNEILEAVAADDQLGFCIACNAPAGPVEPDARNYVCEECGAKAVFGATELLFYCTLA